MLNPFEESSTERMFSTAELKISLKSFEMKNFNQIGSITDSKFQNRIVESRLDDTKVKGLSGLQVKPYTSDVC